MGDIIGDLNKRRGRVMGMNPDPDNRGWQIVEAEVPMGEMSSYAIDLRSMSQGRGSYSLKFVRYEEVPQINQAKIIEDARRQTRNNPEITMAGARIRTAFIIVSFHIPAAWRGSRTAAAAGPPALRNRRARSAGAS